MAAVPAAAEGAECVMIERQTCDYILGRGRAGVLEGGAVPLMVRLGREAGLKAQGLPHGGFNLADGKRLIHRRGRSHGKQVVVYGQSISPAPIPRAHLTG